MKLVPYKKCFDGKSWRCMITTCAEYKNYKSLRIGSFFEGFNLDFSIIIRIIIKYGTRQTRHSIREYFGLLLPTILKVINKLVAFIPVSDF
ncbi:hypothetical protein COBT_002686, partial [Conglomerata obtusa]